MIPNGRTADLVVVNRREDDAQAWGAVIDVFEGDGGKPYLTVEVDSTTWGD